MARKRGIHTYLEEKGWINDSGGSLPRRIWTYIALVSVVFGPLAIYLALLPAVLRLYQWATFSEGFGDWLLAEHADWLIIHHTVWMVAWDADPETAGGVGVPIKTILQYLFWDYSWGAPHVQLALVFGAMTFGLLAFILAEWAFNRR